MAQCGRPSPIRRTIEPYGPCRSSPSVDAPRPRRHGRPAGGAPDPVHRQQPDVLERSAGDGAIARRGREAAHYLSAGGVSRREPRRSLATRGCGARHQARRLVARGAATGTAWRAAWKREPALALYSPDGLHPSRAGTYLAALVIVSRTLGITPIGLPAEGVEPGTAKLLQEVAGAVARPPAQSVLAK